LAEEFPDLSAALDALIARLVDLLPIVRGPRNAFLLLGRAVASAVNSIHD
jgi:hypothetical protein